MQIIDLWQHQIGEIDSQQRLVTVIRPLLTRLSRHGVFRNRNSGSVGTHDGILVVGNWWTQRIEFARPDA